MPFTQEFPRWSSLSSKQMDDFSLKVNQTLMDIVKQHSSGLLQEMMTQHFDEMGKMIRPKMIYDLGHTLDIPIPFLVAWSACCEALHNATLIHDDLQDGDVLRRGRPTIWVTYGAAQAINAGDFLLLLAAKPLLELKMPSDLKVKLLDLFSTMSTKIVGGQSLEFEIKDRIHLQNLREFYMRCVSLKTAALFSGLAEGVGLMADLKAETHKIIIEAYEKLGQIFQIQDDLLDLYGNKGRDIVGCDLKEGKLSFLIVTHLEHYPEDESIIFNILRKKRDQTTTDDVDLIKNIFTEKGTLKRAVLITHGLCNDLLQMESDLLKKGVTIHLQGLINQIMSPIRDIIEPPKNSSVLIGT